METLTVRRPEVLLTQAAEAVYQFDTTLAASIVQASHSIVHLDGRVVANQEFVEHVYDVSQHTSGNELSYAQDVHDATVDEADEQARAEMAAADEQHDVEKQAALEAYWRAVAAADETHRQALAAAQSQHDEMVALADSAIAEAIHESSDSEAIARGELQSSRAALAIIHDTLEGAAQHINAYSRDYVEVRNRIAATEQVIAVAQSEHGVMEKEHRRGEAEIASIGAVMRAYKGEEKTNQALIKAEEDALAKLKALNVREVYLAAHENFQIMCRDAAKPTAAWYEARGRLNKLKITQYDRGEAITAKVDEIRELQAVLLGLEAERQRIEAAIMELVTDVCAMKLINDPAAAAEERPAAIAAEDDEVVAISSIAESQPARLSRVRSMMRSLQLLPAAESEMVEDGHQQLQQERLGA